jgi:SAM-dependent methyltransferase
MLRYNGLYKENLVDPYSKKQLLSFYNFHLQKFGDRPEALRWTPQGQLRRYQMLSDIAPATDLNNATVLDYGCGTGDFYKFLKRRGITVKYTGVDINENFIGLAKQKYPECTFEVMNTDDDRFEGFYDYIFICGVFNLRVPGVENDMKNALLTLFKRCNKGLALSALSSHTPIKDPELHFTSPEEMVKFTIENLSPSIALRHDRIQNDFTLYVYTSYNEIAL